VLSGEATNINFIVFGLTRTVINLRSTALEASTLTITPPVRFITVRGQTVNDTCYFMTAYSTFTLDVDKKNN